MEKINIMTLADHMDDLMFAKADIERKWLNDGKIDKKHSIEKFIGEDLHIAKYMYADGKISIPFNIVEGADKTYFIYTVNEKYDDEFKRLEALIDRTKLNLNKFKKRTNYDIVTMVYDEQSPYIMYDGEFYTE